MTRAIMIYVDDNAVQRRNNCNCAHRNQRHAGQRALDYERIGPLLWYAPVLLINPASLRPAASAGAGRQKDRKMMTASRDHLSKADTVLIAVIEAGVPMLVKARDLIAGTTVPAVKQTIHLSICPKLRGHFFLIIEDEPLVAMYLADLIEEMGGTVAAVAHRADTAVDAIRETVVDAATVDVNLGGKLSFQVALILQDAQIPFAFCTAYTDSVGFPAGLTASKITKSFRKKTVRRVLVDLLRAHEAR